MSIERSEVAKVVAEHYDKHIQDARRVAYLGIVLSPFVIGLVMVGAVIMFMGGVTSGRRTHRDSLQDTLEMLESSTPAALMVAVVLAIVLAPGVVRGVKFGRHIEAGLAPVARRLPVMKGVLRLRYIFPRSDGRLMISMRGEELFQSDAKR